MNDEIINFILKEIDNTSHQLLIALNNGNKLLSESLKNKELVLRQLVEKLRKEFFTYELVKKSLDEKLQKINNHYKTEITNAMVSGFWFVNKDRNEEHFIYEALKEANMILETIDQGDELFLEKYPTLHVLVNIGE